MTGPGIPGTEPADTAKIDAHLAAGGDINDPNIGYRGFGTFLQSAALGGNLPKVRYLLALGANVSVPDQNGGTPLFSAVVGCHKAVAAELMRAGADPDARDATVGTPRELARRTGQIEILRILEGG